MKIKMDFSLEKLTKNVFIAFNPIWFYLKD